MTQTCKEIWVGGWGVFFVVCYCSCCGSVENITSSNSSTEEEEKIRCNDDGFVDGQEVLGCPTNNDPDEIDQNSNQNLDGWTVIEPSPDTRIVYVSSSSGDDSFDGLSPEFENGSGPKRSIKAGLDLIRNHSADWLLLKRGDSWDITQGFGWRLSGRSPEEPILFSSYGSSQELPILNGQFLLRGENLANFTISHIRFENGYFSAVGGSNILVEGCQFEGGVGGVYVVSESHMQNWRIRRNVITRTTTNGMFISGLNNAIIEENVIYRPAVEDSGHGMYITRTGNSDIVTRGNLVFMGKDSGNAIMQRPGGISENNLLVNFGWSGITFGDCNDDGGDYGDSNCFGPVPVIARNNVILSGHSPIGVGISLSGHFILPGSQIVGNIIAFSESSSHNSIKIGESINDLRLEGNVFYNTSSISVEGPPCGPEMTWRNNIFYNNAYNRSLVDFYGLSQVSNFSAEGNRFYSSRRSENDWFNLTNGSSFSSWKSATGETGSAGQVLFVDPTRTLATYNSSLGGEANAEAFFQEAIQQSILNYSPEYSASAVLAYFKEGFTPL